MAEKHQSNPEQSPPGEGIKVAIRMRPLNNKETTTDSLTSSSASRVWRVLKKHNSVTQTTNKGQPLSERVLNRTFFSFDKVFGEDSTTGQVYDDVAKGLVDSVVNGLNGTIFAYGQTSSGKTFTMQGSGGYGGMIKTGTPTKARQAPGIVHLAARDIFKHIENEPNRVFLLRVSFIEIYNEEVRDLLISGAKEPNVLTIREDPRRGVFVNANENIVTSFTGLLDTLFAGEKNRSVAATGMNERSSRSHTIFRITVESRKKCSKKDEEDNKSDIEDSESEDEDITRIGDQDDGSVLISTMNLVDLAGSESVRHTGATGERMKEGAKINQSLLSLSQVMKGLGQPNNTHINFRDSKLTRILQPSLSGNARMAVICCATPSELYLEETRSTLQFASRAKLVKTNAKINEVMDERSLIKKLQRELAAARKTLSLQNNACSSVANDSKVRNEIESLKENNLRIEQDKEHVEDQLKRLKNSILKGGVLNLKDRHCFDNPVKKISDDSNLLRSRKRAPLEFLNSNFQNENAQKRRRRISDGIMIPTTHMDDSSLLFSTPTKTSIRASFSKIFSVDRQIPENKSQPINQFSDECKILREALAVKTNQNNKLIEQYDQCEASIDLLRSEVNDAKGIIATQEKIIEQDKELQAENLSKINKIMCQKEMAQNEKRDLRAILHQLNKHQATLLSRLEEKDKATDSNQVSIEHAEEDMAIVPKVIGEVKEEEMRAILVKLNEHSATLLSRLNDKEELIRAKIQDIQTTNENLKEAQKELRMLSEDTEKLQEENRNLTESNVLLLQEKDKMNEAITDHETKIQKLQTNFNESFDKNESMKCTILQLKETMQVKEDALKSSDQEFQQNKLMIQEMEGALLEEKAASEKQILELQSSHEKLQSVLALSQNENAQLTDQCSTLCAQVDEMKSTLEESEINLNEEKKTLELKITGLMETVDDLTQKVSSADTKVLDLTSENDTIKVEKMEMEKERDDALSKNQNLTESLSNVTDEKATLETELDEIKVTLADSEISLIEEKKSLELKITELVETIDDLNQKVSSADTKMSHLVSENNSINAEKMELEKDRDDALSENQSLTNSLSNVTDEKAALKIQLDEMKNSAADSKISLIEEKKTLELKIIGLMENIDDLTEKVSSADRKMLDLISENDSINSEKMELEKERDDVVKEVERVAESLSSVTTEKATLETQLDEMKNSLADSENRNNAASQSLEDLIEERKHLELKITRLVENVDDLNQKVSSADMKMSDLVSEISSINSEKTELEKERDDALTSMKGLTDALSSSEDEKSQLTEQYHILQSNLDEMKNTMEESERRSKVASQNLQDLNEEKKTLEIKLTELMETIDELKLAVSSTNMNLSDLTTKSESIKVEKIEMEKERDDALSKIKSLTNTLTSLTDEKSNLAEQCNSLETQLEELKNTLKDSESSNNSASQSLQGMVEERKSLELKITGLVETIDDLNQKVSSADTKMSHLVSEIDSINAEKVELEKENVEAVSKIEHLTESLSSVTTEKATLETQLEQTQYDALQSSKQNGSVVQEMEGALLEEKATSEKQILELQSSHEKLQSVLALSQNENAQLTDQCSTLCAQVDEMKSTLEESESSNNAVSQSLEATSEEKKTLELKITGLMETVDDLTQKVSSAGTKVLDLTSENDTIKVEKMEMEKERDDALSKNQNLTESLSNMMTDKATLETELDELKNTLKDSESSNNSASQSLQGMVEERKSLELKITGLVETIDDLNQKVSSADTKMSHLVSEIDSINAEKVELEKENVEAVSKIEHLTESLSSVTTEKATLETQLEQTQYDALQSSKQNGSVVQEMEGALLEEKAASEKQILELQSSHEKLQSVLALSQNENAQLTDQCSTLCAQVDEMKSTLEESEINLNEEKKTLELKITGLMETVDDLTQKVSSADTKVLDLTSENDTIKVEKMEMEKERDDALSKNQNLTESLSSMMTEKATLETMLEQLERNSSNDNTETLCDQSVDLLEVIESNKALQEEITEKKALIHEQTTMMAELQDEVKSVKTKFMEKELLGLDGGGTDISVVSTLKAEVSELEHLLADANKSVEDARAAADASDRELEEKEKDLEEAFQIASERDEAARVALERIQELEKNHLQIDSGQGESTEEELMKDMELLLEEKMQLESMLEQEIMDRKKYEDIMKQKMGEEQRLLVSEAENSMNQLRQQLLSIEKDLEEKQIENTSMNNIMFDNQEKIKRYEKEISETALIIASLRDDCSSSKQNENLLKKEIAELKASSEQFKTQIFTVKEEVDAKIRTLEEEIDCKSCEIDKYEITLEGSKAEVNRLLEEKDRIMNQMHLTKQSLTREKDFAVSKLKEELACLRVTVTQAEGESYSAKKEARDVKDQFRRLRSQLSSLKQNLSNEADAALVDMRERLSDIEEERDTVRIKLEDCQEKLTKTNSQIVKLEENEEVLLHKLEVNRKELIKTRDNKEKTGSIAGFRVEMSKMKEELKEKSKRIKMLEKVRLTKEQCAALKKMKEERIHYMGEVKNLRGQLEQKEKEMLNLQDERKSETENKVSGMDLLETKLRKYATHCQHLEAEKTSIADILKACVNEQIDQPEENIAEAVAYVCDKLKSTEEECIALANSEGKIVSCMMELDRLRGDKTNLEQNLSETHNEVVSLRESKNDLKKNLQSTEKKMISLEKQRNELQKMVRNAKGNAADLKEEKGRQVRYLEQENLQLMQELKHAKKEVQKVRTEFEAFRDEETYNSVLDSKKVRSVKKINPPKGKENQPNLRESPKSSHKKSPLKEISAMTPNNPNPFSSLKKKTRSQSRYSMTPKAADATLGIDSVVGEDETVQDCKQS